VKKALEGKGVKDTLGYKRGCPYGSHRVLEPEGGLPQAAWRIDNSPAIYDNEMLVDVRTLNIDSASFKRSSDGAILL
jgi:L-erythro-3,5-diaminohexanoate dehydrogenase